MPLAQVRVKKLPTEETEISQLMHALHMLRHVVAEQLSCTDPNGGLISDDVEVEVTESSEFDHSQYDVKLALEAMAFPSRMLNIEERCQRIFNDFIYLLPPRYQTMYLWFTPVSGAVFTDKVVKTS